jgi:hypothetical protein
VYIIADLNCKSLIAGGTEGGSHEGQKKKEKQAPRTHSLQEKENARAPEKVDAIVPSPPE